MDFELLEGPWSVANVHPASRIVLSVPERLGGGVVYSTPGGVVAVGGEGERGRAGAEVAFVCGVEVGGGDGGGKWILGGEDGSIYGLVSHAPCPAHVLLRGEKSPFMS